MSSPYEPTSPQSWGNPGSGSAPLYPANGPAYPPGPVAPYWPGPHSEMRPPAPRPPTDHIVIGIAIAFMLIVGLALAWRFNLGPLGHSNVQMAQTPQITDTPTVRTLYQADWSNGLNGWSAIRSPRNSARGAHKQSLRVL